MKTIVVYQSSTGFTKQYAEWIATELGCKAKELKKVSETEIASYDCVIYGGWIMGNTIVGRDKIKKMNPKQLVTFATGASPDGENTRKAIETQNNLGEEPWFYMESGFRFDKLNLFVRMMLKVMKKSVAKKKEKTEQDRYMEKVLGTSFDHSNPNYCTSLVSYVRAMGYN